MLHFFRRLIHVLRDRRHAADLRDEMETHRALRQAQLERDGMSASEAFHASRRALGSVTLAAEDTRGVWLPAWLEGVWQDVRFAARSLTRTPVFAMTAVLTLAVGIGANAAMFSMADATGFRPPDVPRPGELIRIFSTSIDAPFGEVSYPDYVDFRSRVTSISGLVAYEVLDFSLARTPTDAAEYVGGAAVSGNFFSVLEVEPHLGRGFGFDDERTDARVAVLSHRLWTRSFQQDPSIVGSRIRLSGSEFVVVGVAPESFLGTEQYFHPDLYVPLRAIHSVFAGAPADLLEDRTDLWLTVVGRRRSGATMTQVNDEVAAVARALDAAYPLPGRSRGATARSEMAARAEVDRGGYQGAIVMAGLIALVLLLTSANVANLVAARTAARGHEMALRRAIGATPWRLIRLGLAESAVIATAGAIAALAVASATIAHLETMVVFQSALPIFIDLRVDGRLACFIVLASLLAGSVFGLVPAIGASRLAGRTWQTRTATAGRHRRVGLRSAFLTVQVVVSLLVLVTAGVLIRASQAAGRVDPGFRTDRVLLASFNTGMVRYDNAKAAQYYDDILDEIRTLPGVEAAGLTRFVPMGVSSGTTSLVVDGFELPEGQDRLIVPRNVTDPAYWRVIRTPIVRGRAFDARDTGSSAPVMIVNETIAARYWPGQDPIGRTVRIPDASGQRVEVIGVARDAKFGALAESPRPFVYLPYSQHPSLAMTVVVLTTGDPAGLAPDVRRAAQAVDASVPMFDLRTFSDAYQWWALGPSRLMSTLVTALGLLALSVAAVGLYGVLAYLCGQRTREIGIRIAVGATPIRVAALIATHTAALVVPGLVLGLVLAFFLMPLISAPAFDFVTPREPLVFAVAVLVVASVAALAGAIPARRAARIDPTVALRAE